MTPTLIEAARAALDALSCDTESLDDPGHRCSHCDDYVDRNGPVRKALRAAIEAAEKAEPVAYRVEIRWRDRALDQSWRKYADTAYQDSAISLRDSENNMETESRIVPLFAGEPARTPAQCRCTFAQRIVGDGCEVCNPELAQRLAAEAQTDTIKETTR